MNVERLTEMACWCELGAPERGGVAGFGMRFYGNCGTVCCLAGTAIQWYYPGGLEEAYEHELGLSEVAADLLDLTDWQRIDLFLPSGAAELTTDTAWAARTIRHLLATGTADWNATREAV